MKKIVLLQILLIVTMSALAQAKPSQPASAADMEKLLEAEMKGLSDEEKDQMRKMMKGIIPEMAKQPGPDAIEFKDNKKLVPAKDAVRIQSISKKIFTEADVTSTTAQLYGKLMAKMPAEEKTIARNVMAKATTGSLLMEAAVISFVQGHNYAAMALAMKAVQAEPKSVIYQNNLAAMLSQSGFPERAIPYLKKLSVQFPSNSTVLHNLGYAWLQLGEVDTARRLFAYAAANNPGNPETSVCRGVIEELRGDPNKAADHYVEAFERAPNPFAENLIKNVNAADRLEKIDFNKLKNRISIYEYFKKDWIKIHDLIDDVAHYENNKKIQNGLSNMFTKLDDKINDMAEASSAELEALAEKGETEFIQMMAKEHQKGISMISMPAVYINKILLAHIAKWQQDYVHEYHNLMAEIQQRKAEMTKYSDNDKCPDFDRKNNAFMQYANPLIRKFHSTKIEEARAWLNAYCTWSWYITGNPKNTVVTQCITWTAFMAKMYASAINDQYAIARSCVNQDGDGASDIDEPAIPNFTCPAVVAIPFGLDELRLSADALNFDDNDWGIKTADGGKNPNMTLTHGIDKNYIAEPGKYGNPTTKVGSGHIVPPGLGDDELMPLSKIIDELTPLSKIPPDELAPLDPSPLRKEKLGRSDLGKIRNADLSRKLLREITQAKCPGELPGKKKRKSKFTVGIGEIEVEDTFEVGIGELELWDEEVMAWVNTKGELRFEKNFEVGIGEIEWEDVKTNGPQITITNGLDAAAGRLINFVKGLFD